MQPSKNAGRTGPSIIFTGCTATSAAAGQPQAGGQRRHVTVGGRRVKTIDVHAHCIVPKAYEMMGRKMEDHQFPNLDEVGPKRMADMDRQGVDIEALSINPFWYRAERDLAAEVVRIQNDELAQMCGRYPDRIVAFASLALQFPDLAVQQLEHGVKKLGLRGAAVGASCAGDEFSDPKFHPVWAKAEELGVLIFIHPQSTPELSKRFKGNGWLANTIGNPLDTTICLSHLIFEGTLDRFPGLKICAAHGGGFLPSYAPRSDNACRVAPWHCDANVKLKKKPTEYMKMMYYDTLVFTSEMLRHLAAEVGSSQLVIGTDHPIPWHEDPVTHIMNAPGFSDEERIAMLGGTAAKLLGIKTEPASQFRGPCALKARRRRRINVIRAAISLVLAVALATPAIAATSKGNKKSGVHGAIAVNRDSKAVGYAYDFKTAQDAKREALKQCGEKKCEVVASFRGGCAAVSAGGKRLASSTGATRDEAETKATRKCGKDCAVLAWACTKDK